MKKIACMYFMIELNKNTILLKLKQEVKPLNNI